MTRASIRKRTGYTTVTRLTVYSSSRTHLWLPDLRRWLAYSSFGRLTTDETDVSLFITACDLSHDMFYIKKIIIAKIKI